MATFCSRRGDAGSFEQRAALRTLNTEAALRCKSQFQQRLHWERQKAAAWWLITGINWLA
ncbi:hypothetical protein MJ560_13670 [Klebsiella pneumoniae]|nr:hypothetical protein MJ560_13670 [Klebsiella pneumoniae]